MAFSVSCGRRLQAQLSVGRSEPNDGGRGYEFWSMDMISGVVVQCMPLHRLELCAGKVRVSDILGLVCQDSKLANFQTYKLVYNVRTSTLKEQPCICKRAAFDANVPYISYNV